MVVPFCNGQKKEERGMEERVGKGKERFGWDRKGGDIKICSCL